MSHLRTYVISRRQFASLGVEQDAETWFERLRQFKLELESDIPSLRSLQASVLKLSFTPSDSGAHLIARLEESEQISLSEHKNGGVVLDLFGIDVRREAHGSTFTLNWVCCRLCSGSSKS